MKSGTLTLGRAARKETGAGCEKKGEENDRVLPGVRKDTVENCSSVFSDWVVSAS